MAERRSPFVQDVGAVSGDFPGSTVGHMPVKPALQLGFCPMSSRVMYKSVPDPIVKLDATQDVAYALDAK